MAPFSWVRWLRSLLQPRGQTIRKATHQLRLEVLESRLAPATFTWSGAGKDSNWSTSANWVGGAAPTGSTTVLDDLVFSGSASNRNAVNDLTGSGGSLPTFNSITIAGSSYNLSGKQIALGSSSASGSGSLIVNSGASGEAISLDIKLGGAGGGQQFFTINSGADLTISGKLSGSTGVELTKEGTGKLTLGNDNSGFTGPITIDHDSGILVITNNKALGDSTNGTTVGNNSQLQVNNVTGNIAENLTLNGTGISQDGALLNVAGTNTWAGTVNLATDGLLGVNAGTLEISGVISDLGSGHSVTKIGTGQLIFSAANTYRGGTTVTNGILTIRNAGALGTADGTAATGTLINNNPVFGTGTLQLEDPTGNGFTVKDELVTLNGPGFGNIGALNNLNGLNHWAGPVVLGSGGTAGTDVTIGVAAATTTNPKTDLTIDGVISDPGRPGTALTKIQGGRLILTNANTYIGTTTVSAGVLNARDSQAMGPSTQRTVSVTGSSGTFTLTYNGKSTSALAYNSTAGQVQAALNALSTIGGAGGSVIVSLSGTTYTITFGGSLAGLTTVPLSASGAGGATTAVANRLNTLNVSNNAALELQVDSGADPHGRDLASDSVTGVGNKLALQLTINITGSGITGATGNATGALRSVSGINTWVAGTVSLAGGTAAIGVDPDPNPSSTNAYFTNDYSLTVQSNIAGSTTLAKVGTGQLILPNANTYTAQTQIKEGWITIQNEMSLGAFIAGSDPIQPSAVVSAGAALHLKPSAPGASFNLVKNLVLSGNGITHPFALINQKGALMTLGGNDVVGGPNANARMSSIQLSGNAGIGVEEVDPAYAAAVPSELTITAAISDLIGSTTPGGLTKLGSRRLVLQGVGTYTGDVLIQEGVLRAEGDTALGLATTGTAATGNNSYSTTNTTVGTGIAEVQSFTVTGSSGTFTLSFNGSTTGPLAFNVPASGGTGATASVQNALNALLTGTGGTVTVNQSSSVYTVVFGGKLVGVNQPQLVATGSGGASVAVTTLVEGDGAALEVQSAPPASNGGIAAGIQVYNEHLTLAGSGNATFGDSVFSVLSQGDSVWRGPISLNTSAVLQTPPGSRLILYGAIDDAANTSPSGSDLILSGGGNLALAGANTYRGTTFVNQGILELLNSQALGGTGVSETQTVTLSGSTTGSFTLSFNGQSTSSLAANSTAAAVQTALNALSTIGGAGGSVAVSLSGKVFTVTFGGNLSGFNQPSLVASVSGGTNATIGTLTDGGGGTVVADGAALQLEGSLTVAGEPLIVQGQGLAQDDNLPAGWFAVGPAPINNGQTDGTQAVTGRITGIVTDPSDANVIYITTAGGGAWKTRDGGKTWQPLFDQRGNGNNNEVQTVTVTGTAGTFKLTFNGQSTASLAFNASANQVQSALNALSTIGGVGGSVSVSLGGGVYTVTFGGVLAGANVPLMTATGSGGATVTTATSTDGGPIIASEEQLVTVTGSAGNFTLSFLGQTTSSLANNATAAQVQSALNALSTIGGVGGSVSVTLSGGVYDITFGDNLKGQDLPLLTATGSGGTNATVTGFADGYGIIVESQQLGVANPSGNFTLTFAGQTTASLAGNATLAQVQTALNNLSTIGGVGGTATVQNLPVPVFTVDFGGPNAGTNQPQMTGTGAGGATVNVVTVTDGSKVQTPEVQVVHVTGTAGTFKLTFNGQSTNSLAYNASASTVQSALNSLGSIRGFGNPKGSVTVSQSGGDYTVTFNGGPLNGVNQNQMTATGSGGATVSVTTTTDGSTVATDEVQRVSVTGKSGSFTLTFNGQTTASLPYNASASDVQSALNALQNISFGFGKAGPVTVTLAPSSFMSVSFGGTLLGLNVPLMTASGSAGATVQPISDGFGTTAGIQTFSVTGSAGTFTLGFNGATTAPLPFNATAAQVQTALNSLATIGGVDGSVGVTLSGTTYTVTFYDDLAGNGLPQLVVTGSGGATAQLIAAAAGAPQDSPLYIGALAMDPSNSRTLYIGTGETNNSIDSFYGTGIYKSTDAGQSWTLMTDLSGGNPFYGKGISKIAFDSNGDLFAAVGDGGSGRDEIQTLNFALPSGPQTFTLSFLGADSTGAVTQYTTADITYDPSRQNNNALVAADIATALNGLANIGGIGGTVVVTAPTGGKGGSRNFTITFQGALSKTNVEQLTTNWPTPAPGTAGIAVGTTADGGPLKVINGTTGGPGIWRFMNGTWFNMTTVVSKNRASVASTNTTSTPNPNPPKTPGPDDNYLISFPQTGVTWSDVLVVGSKLFAVLGNGSGNNNNGIFYTTDLTSTTPVWYAGDPTNANPSPPPANLPDGRAGKEFPSLANGGSAAGNIKVAATGSTVYASAATPTGGLLGVYVTTDGGLNWGTVTTAPSDYFSSHGDYANAIIVSGSTIYVAGYESSSSSHTSQIYRSTDGGSSWKDISVDSNSNSPHAAVHTLAFDSQGRLLVGTDGGLWRLESNSTWTDLNGNLETLQVLSVASNPTDPAGIFAGSQTNGVERFGGSLAWSYIDQSNNSLTSGGGEIQLDPTNPNNIYYVQLLSGANATIRRSTDGGQTWSTVLTTTRTTAPLVLDTIKPKRLLAGGANLKESTDQGANWTDLGVPLVDVTAIAVAAYQGVFVADPDFTSVADQGANTYDANTIYATNGNSIYLSKDHGQTWVDRTTDLLGLGGIADIEVDPRNRDVLYAVRKVFGGSHVFRSTDAGQSWTDISANLPNLPVWKLVIDPREGDPNAAAPTYGDLYIGTDTGVWVLPSGDSQWHRVGVAMPNVQVHDLELNQTTNILLAGTYGRGVYQLFLEQGDAHGGAFSAVSGNSIWTGRVIFAGSTTINASGSQALQNGLSTASLTIVGAISELSAAGTSALTKIGGGNLVLSGPNSYRGLTDIQQGVVVVHNSQALGSATAGTIVEAGTSLELQSNLDLEPITLNGDGVPNPYNGHNTGSLRNLSNNNVYTGTLTLNSSVTIGVDSGSSLTIGSPGSIVGADTADLTKELAGTLVFDTANTYGGVTTVNQGVLQIQSGQALGGTNNGTHVLDGAQLQLQSPTGGGSVVVSGESLSLSGTGIFGTGALLDTGGQHTWQGPITLDSEPGFSPETAPAGAVAVGVTKAVDQLTIDGPVTESLATGLRKVGAGKLVLAQANSYTGTTYVDAGSLAIRDSASLGGNSTSEVQRITLGGTPGTFTLSFNGQTTGSLDSAVAASGGSGATASVQNALNALSSIGGVGGSVAVTLTVVTTATAGNPVTHNVYTVTFGGSLAGVNVPQIVAVGSGGTTAAASTVADGGVGTLVSSGAALQLDGDPTTSGASISVNGEALVLNGTGIASAGGLENVSGNNGWTGPIVLATDTSIGVDATTKLTVSGTIQDPSPLVYPVANLAKVGTGTLVLPNANTYSGQTNINAGVVNIRNAASLGGASASEVQQLTIGGANTGTFTLTFNGKTTGTLAFNVPGSGGTGATASIQNALNALSSISNVGGSVTVSQSGNVYTVTFGGSLALTSLPLLTAAGANGTTVGVSRVTAGSGGTNVASGATLQLQAVNTVFANEALTLSGLGYNGAGALEDSSGSNTWDRAITLAGNASIGVDNNTDRLIIDQPIADGGKGYGVTKIGPGTLQYKGASGNTYTGLTQVNQGLLELNASGGATAVAGDLTVGDNVAGAASAKLLASGELASTSNVKVNSDGTFDLNTFTQTVAALTVNGGTVDLTGGSSTLTLTGDVAGTSAALITGAGTLSLGGATRKFTVTPGAGSPDMTVDAVIAGVNSTDGLTKEGAGTLRLTQDNTFGGTTTVNLGTVLADGPTTANTLGAITLNSGTVGGKGKVGTIDSTAGTVAPGDDTTATGTGTLTSSTVTLDSNSTFFVVLNGTGTGQYDSLAVNGDIYLNSATLDGLTGSGVNINDKFTIISTTGGTVHGRFAELHGSGIAFVGGQKYSVDYSDSTKVVLQRIKNVTSTSLTASDNPSKYGEDVLFTATVTPEAGAAAVPTTDSVTFTLDGNSSLTQTIKVDSSGKAVFSPQTLIGGFLTLGNHTVDAHFNGDSSYQTSDATQVTLKVNPSDTTTSLAADVASPVFGQTVTITATVAPQSPGVGFPTGKLTFTVDGTAKSPSATLDSAGKATFQFNTLSVGTHHFLASYAGDGNYNSSAASDLTVVISKDTALVVVDSGTLSSSTYSQQVTFKATVSSVSPGTATPTGTVSFFDGAVPGGTLLATKTLSGGVATLQISTLGAADHTITAQYNGDANVDTNTGTLDFVVNQATTTTGTPTSSANPGGLGDPVVYSVTVTATSPAVGPPVGQVTFVIDGVNQAAVSLNSSGVASITRTNLAAGTHSISAAYAGNANYAGSSSAASLSETIVNATTVKITAPTAASVYGQPVVFTATVAVKSPGTGIPTGSVSFVVDGVAQTPVPLDSAGKATLTLSGLAAQTSAHTVGANYLGSSNFAASSTNSASLEVNKASVAAAITSDHPTAVYGNIVNITATMNPTSPGGGTPDGYVQFIIDNVVFPYMPLDSSGKYTMQIPGTNPLIGFLNVGDHTIGLNYLGSSNYSAYSTPTRTPQKITIAPTSGNTTSSLATSVVGQQVTFTATVKAPSSIPTPDGYVQFVLDGATRGDPVALDATGKATINVSDLHQGDHTVGFNYFGTLNFAALSVLPTKVLTINAADTSLSVAAANTVFGQPVNYVATITANSPSTAVPTGSVTIYIDGTPLTPVPIDSKTGKATLTLNPVAVMTHTVQAKYTGNSDFNASTSAVINQTVSQAATTTALTTPVSVTGLGEPVTFTATVTPETASVLAPSGTVTFTINSTGGSVDYPVTLDSTGKATLTRTDIPLGNYTVVAKFAANTGYQGSTSNTLSQTIRYASSIAVTSSGSTKFGQSVTFTATVTGVAPATATPSGNMQFVIDGVATVVGLDSNGVAKLTRSDLAAGDHTFGADYFGDSNYAGKSTAALQTQHVDKASTTVAVTSPGSITFGQSVTFTATVLTASPGSGTPSGQVQFIVDGVAQTGTVGLDSSGKATLTVSGLGAGSHTAGANFFGSANFAAASTSQLWSQAVNQASTSTSGSLSATTVTVGQPVTLSATVTSSVGVPTGQVTFVVDNVAHGTANVDPTTGVASITVSDLTIGTHSVLPVYLGSTNYHYSFPASALTLTVKDVAHVADLNLAVSSNIMTSTAFSLSVTAVDAGGNQITSDSDQVTVSMDSGPTNATFSGTTTKSFVAGQISFDDLMVSKPGQYTLRVTTGTFSKTITFSAAGRTT